MMSAHDTDIIEIPGYPGMFTRRKVVRMWQAAGSPVINSAGRLYAAQLEAYKKYLSGQGSPADNPDNLTLPLAHVRFAALDVQSDTASMRAAGFSFPYPREPWHAELPNVRQYPIVKEEDMPISKEEYAQIRAIVRDEIKAERPRIVSAIFARMFNEIKPESGAPIPAENFAQKIARIRLGIRNLAEKKPE